MSSDMQRVIRSVAMVGEELLRLQSRNLQRLAKAPAVAAGAGRDAVQQLRHTWCDGSPAAPSAAAMPPMPPPSPPSHLTVGTAAPPQPDLAVHGGGVHRQEVESTDAAASHWAVSAASASASSASSASASASTVPPEPAPPASATAAAAPAAADESYRVPNPERKKKQFRERKVPAGPVARAVGFGSMAAGLVFGTLADSVQGAFRGAPPSSSPSDGGAPAKPGVTYPSYLTESNATRLAEGLCRMRGASLKLGQMLSLVDETVLPPPIVQALARVREQADIMPRYQLEQVLVEDLGADWRSHFAEFSDEPLAAASIGQVHRAVLHDGRAVAVKVQYPGVAESIESDILNLERLVTMANVLPKGLYVDSIIEVAREELGEEVDYRLEAEKQLRFRSLMNLEGDFIVPDVVQELSTRRVLTTELVPGVPLDQCTELPQATRNHIGRLLLKLTLEELFAFQFMQSDPNTSNFLYDAPTGRMAVIDFGAAQSYSRDFMREYLTLVWAAAENDVDTLQDVSVDMGFLTGDETDAMMKAHAQAGLVVGEPFRTDAPFDFKGSGIVQRISAHGDTFATQRLTPPPKETYSLHRRLSGCYMTCIRLGAVFPCRDLLVKYRELFLAKDAEGTR